MTIPYGPQRNHSSASTSTRPVVDQPGEPRGVDPAAQQIRVLRLAGQHVHELQPGRKPILEVGQLLGEHHRARVPVAVHQRERARRLGRQRGRDQREDRRDAGPGRDGDVATGALGRERRREVAERRHHLDRVPGAELGRRELGERAAADRLHADAQPAGRASSAGVEQIEYDRRTSSPSSIRRTVRCWPAVNAYVLAQLRRHVEASRRRRRRSARRSRRRAARGTSGGGAPAG